MIFGVVDSLVVIVVFGFELRSHRDDGLDTLLVGVDVCFDGFVFFEGRLHAREILTEVVLRDEMLILLQPCFAHARLAIEARSQLLEFFLSAKLWVGILGFEWIL